MKQASDSAERAVSPELSESGDFPEPRDFPEPSAFSAAEPTQDGGDPTPTRIGFDVDDAGAGLGQLVLAILEIVRQLLERQAIRRVEAGSLTDDEIERLGSALLALEIRFAELHETFRVRQGAPGAPDRPRQATHSTGPDSGQNGERP
jgi:hypothetical protein